MNPYDFVPLDLEHPPKLRQPVWHAEFTRTNGQKVYSGHISVYMRAETPLFIRDGATSTQDSRRAGTHMRNKNGEYIIPGSSIKGLLRSVVETLCGGCILMFRIPREYTHNPLPPGFAACTNNANLCLACRLFGMMGRREDRRDGIDTFLGKVNIGDAPAYEDSVALYDPIYTAVLDAPKPRHRAFYLDQQGRYIAGRKFYFHHDGELRTENRLLEIRNTGEYRNQHIQPLESETEFDARIDFTQLEADEFAALLLAITLLPDMRHKLGYGKPLGLGSVQLIPNGLTLIDYTTRYSAFRAGRGMTSYNTEEVAALLKERWASLDPQISETIARFCSYPSLPHLQRIWHWPPDRSVDYCYPSQRWFKEHAQARISATRDLYPGD